MKVVIFTASPNQDGLTAACGLCAEEGAASAGASVLKIDLNQWHIGRCHACGNGWGTCREKHYCQVEDDFQELHEMIRQGSAFILVTPVYWGEMSESAKAFFDRLRRCEALRKEESLFYDKPVVGIAAAGGSGGGTMTCLTAVQNLFTHMGGRIFDLMPVTRKNRDYQLPNIVRCSSELVHKNMV